MSSDFNLDTITNIGSYSFYGFSLLKSIELPESLESIGNYAFESSGIETISIPTNVKSIGINPFVNCQSLTGIEMKSSSFEYDSTNKILYDLGKTKIKVIDHSNYISDI